ncbi:hypothetical protein Trydic_g6469 [Trypoxylus dichotomus]
MGSVLRRKPPGVQRTPGNIEAVRTSVARSPTPGARKCEAALDLNHVVLQRDFRFHHYKVQVVQELQALDYNTR